MTLDVSKLYVIKLFYYWNFSVPKLLNIFTIEAIMKMSPMIVQGLWENKSLFLQLPYIQEEHLKYFSSKKVQNQDKSK